MNDTQTVILVVTHHTLPGQRDAARAVWEKHMAPAVKANPGHLAYYYCLDPTQPNIITAFQQYRSADDAATFLQTDAYLAYEREVTALLAGAPQVQQLTPAWSKTPA